MPSDSPHMSVCVDQPLFADNNEPFGWEWGGEGESERVPIQYYFQLGLSTRSLFQIVFVKFVSQQLAEEKSGCSKCFPLPLHSALPLSDSYHRDAPFFIWMCLHSLIFVF